MRDKIMTLQGGRVNITDFCLSRYTARIPVSHDIEDVEKPGYFRNYADTFAKCLIKGALRLEVLSDDYSVHAEYLVTQATKSDIKLRLLHLHHGEVDHTTRSEAVSADKERFRANWGARQKWRILDGDAIAAKGMEKDDCVALVDDLNAGVKDVTDIPVDYAA